MTKLTKSTQYATEALMEFQDGANILITLEHVPMAKKIQASPKKRGCNPRGKMWFSLMRFAHKHFPPMEPDHGYWEKQGWHGKGRPWR